MSDLERAFLEHLGNQFTPYIGREGGAPKPEAEREKERMDRKRKLERRLAEVERKRQERMAEERKRLLREAAEASGTKFKFDQIVRAVCAVHDVTENELLIFNRRRNLVVARGHIMYLARMYLNMGWSEIGRAMKRDHTTVMHAVEQFEEKGLDKRTQDEVLALLAGVIPALASDKSS